MSKALSVDLRVRVLGAVAAGATHREAAERFGVSAASVSRWRKREREQGDPRPKALGGDRRSGRIEAHRDAVDGGARTQAGTPRSRKFERALRGRVSSSASARSSASSPATPSRAKKDRARQRAGSPRRPDAARSSGSRASSTSIPSGWSSSTRPGPRPTWPGAMAAAGAASGCGSACRTATGRPPPSSAR